MKQKMIKDLVSIIIPTYNNANTICNSIDSCFKQTYKNIEVIVIDDGSTDDTKKVLNEYLSNDKFKYIYQDNQERSAARNHGLDIAKGEYIQFLDSDDMLYEDKIEIQVNFLKNNEEYFMVYCGVEYINKNGQTIDTLEKKSLGVITDELLKGNFITIHSPLIRKNDIRFSIDLNRLEDWEYWILSTYDKKVAYIDNVLCMVTVDVQNSKKYIIEMFKNEIKVYNKLIQNKLFYTKKNLIAYSKYKRYISILIKKVLS